MAKDFLQTLNETVQSEYPFRIKTLIEPTPERMDKLEKFLRKYGAIDITPPVRTIIQDNPLDFKDVGSNEVYIVDVVLTIPVSAYIMHEEILSIWAMADKFLVVRSISDNLELQDREMLLKQEIVDDMAKNDWQPAATLMSTEPEYPEASLYKDQAFGNEATNEFLEYLASIRANRPTKVVIADMEIWNLIKNPAPENEVKGSVDTFNDKIDGAPKVVKTPTVSKGIKDPRKFDTVGMSTVGNFNSDKKPQYRTAVDYMGKKHFIAKK